MNNDPLAWQHALAVTRPALLLASPNFIEETAARLAAAGVQDAVRRRDSAVLYDFLMTLVSLQGISDERALAWDAEHGGITWNQVEAAFASKPTCPRLCSYWTFAGCGFRKGAGTCAESHHLPLCPLPTHPLRKGGLNRAAYALFLFIRDVCANDIVGWIDRRLSDADPGLGAPDRTLRLRKSLIGPLVNIDNIGPKLWSMMLAELLLASDPARERWCAAGASLMAVDSLIHNFLHRTGILRRFEAEHRIGPDCYAPGGCAEVIEGLANRFDARSINATFPAVFPRLLQQILWRFCSGMGGLDICNGNRIDDRHRCAQHFCPAGPECNRIALRS